jgi:hypothetical protein
MTSQESPSNLEIYEKIFEKYEVLTTKQKIYYNELEEIAEGIGSNEQVNRTICSKTLQSIFLNVIKNPSIEKFRRIDIQNEKFQKRILVSDSAIKLIEKVGFKVTIYKEKKIYFLEQDFKEQDLEM